MTAFLTSRYGKINSLSLHEYKFNSSMYGDNKYRETEIKILKSQCASQLFKFVKGGFQTLTEIANKPHVYKKTKSFHLHPPFQNIPKLSLWLKAFFDNQLKNEYKIHENIYILEEKPIGFFNIVKGFDFNIELFGDGRFLIHFFQVSKITLQKQNFKSFIWTLRSIEKESSRVSTFNFYNSTKSTRTTIYPNDEKSLDYLMAIQEKEPAGHVTVNMHFLKEWFPNNINSIIKTTKPNINIVIPHLENAAKVLEADAQMRLYEKPHLPFTSIKIQPEMNLIIGGKKKVSKLSALYYNGALIPVNVGTILPLIYTQNIHSTFSLSKIINLINQRFNIKGDIKWLPSINVKHQNIESDQLKEIVRDHPNVLFIILTDETVPIPFIEKLKNTRVRFQIIKEPVDNFMLSNFAVKCLSKLGAKIAALSEMNVPKDTCFVGIDLGHSHQSNSKSNKGSSMVFVFYNNLGDKMWQYRMDNIELDESLKEEYILFMLVQFKNTLALLKKELPSQFIFHRDGKVHRKDIQYLLKACQSVFETEKVDIVEIIKSGYPYLYKKNGVGYINLESSYCFMSQEHNYAILVTNDQKIEPHDVHHPIVIKRKHGVTPFNIIVSQVYWFCKVYTNNIYFPTRLPATTETANNLAGTGVKGYKATYKKG